MPSSDHSDQSRISRRQAVRVGSLGASAFVGGGSMSDVQAEEATPGAAQVGLPAET
jgi:hypothetical protein